MKSFFYAAVSLLSITSTLAAPKSEGALEDHKDFNLWNPGYKPYKYKIFSPEKPCDQKYLCSKPSKEGEPDHLGYQSEFQTDFQFYFTQGYGNNYGYGQYHPGTESAPQYPEKVCLAGSHGWENVYHVQQPEQHQWSQGWEHHSDEWEVSPYYQELKWDQINRNFFQQQHYWEPPQGYKWIGCEDGKGGYDVKAWDGKHEVDAKYYEIQIEVEAQYQQWGFSWS